MGLDGVEFVIEVEHWFGITIADSDAEKMRTIGEFVRYVADSEGIDMDSQSLTAAEQARLEEIRKRVHSIVLQIFKADPASLSDSTHLVDDFV